MMLNKYITILFLFFSFQNTNAQELGFCNGNSGDPIFTDDFGTGTQQSELPAGTTEYNYANGGNPNDGFYTVSSSTNFFDWHNTTDHTPGDTNGKMLIINSNAVAGEFYRTTITGLCENTTYEFSSWLLNLTPSGGSCGADLKPINVKFEIWDDTDTSLLAWGDTGNITSTPNPVWNQFALVFQTIPNQTSVILKMINNGDGGCGNDLAIDDIVFKTCGDTIIVQDDNNNASETICSSQAPYTTTLTAVPDGTVFDTHFYQWQESTDNNAWTDMIGEINDNITVTVNSTKYYRAKVAEYALNLSNSDCITFSDVFALTVNQLPTEPSTSCWETAVIDENTCSWTISGTQPTEPTNLECWETATFNNTTCTWEVNGTQPTEPTNLECWETTSFNNTTCTWDINGTQPTEPTNLECWETATFNNTTCTWEVSGTQPTEPTNLECWETTSFNNTTCTWDINGTQPTEPTNLECWETATFNNTTCTWEVSGTPPTEPTDLECWETATINQTTCEWEVTGSQPAEPTNLECWETTTFNTATCTWDINGTQPTEPTNLECWETATFNNTTCEWETTGTPPEEPSDLECWQETTFNTTTCMWDIIGTQPEQTIEEHVQLCKDESLILYANTTLNNPMFLWNTNATSESITINSIGTYSVEISSDDCYFITKTFYVTNSETPELANIVSDNHNIIISTINQGDFEYSIDGVTYQDSTVFTSIEGGLYTIHVRDKNGCSTITQEFIHLVIPKYFTPNGDTYNDYFEIKGLSSFKNNSIHIFNRFGKLLYAKKNERVAWDGTLNNKLLPTSDYWYIITIDGKKIAGHFSLIR